MSTLMRPSRRKLIALAAAGLVAASACSCSSTTTSGQSSGTALSNAEQQQSFTHLVYIEPLPNFPYSEIRQNLIEVEAIEALGITSTTFVFVPGIQHPVFVCPSVGVPIPVTDSLSNNLVPVFAKTGAGNGGYNIAGVTVDQEDPTGIFQGASTATNSLCLNGQGQEFDFYNEAFDLSVTAPAYWDQTTGMIKLDGPAVYPVCRVVILNAHKQQAEEVCTKPTTTSASVHGTGGPGTPLSYHVAGVTRQGVVLGA